MTKSTDHNIATLLDMAAIQHPKRDALIFGNHRITFAELTTKVQQCANLFKKHGLQHGQRVIIMIPMSPELYIALLAVIRCGATAVFVDPWIPMRQIAAFSSFALPRGFVGVPKAHLLRLLDLNLTRVKISFSTGPVILGIPARFSLQSAKNQPIQIEPFPVSPDDSALITFTSGSSGTPKGANRTHGFLKAQYEALCNELDYRDNDIDMPMFPVFALRNLAAGITSVIPDMDFRRVSEVDPTVINRQIRKSGVTLVTASPPFIDQLAKLRNPPTLRKILTGGAPVNVRQLNRWHEAFPNTGIDIIYGSTEAEPVAHIGSHERLANEDKEGFCCGKPSPLLNTRIVKIRKEKIPPEELDTLTLPQGEIGELLVSGKHVCRDYFKNPDAVTENKIIESDGTCWHRMGDTGYFDKNGCFFLTGRVHSTIIRNGKILHAQVEEARIEKQLAHAKRVAALEHKDQLLVVVQGEPVCNPEKLLNADRVIFTSKTLPVDPRHNSKIDYSRLLNMIEKGKL